MCFTLSKIHCIQKNDRISGVVSKHKTHHAECFTFTFLHSNTFNIIFQQDGALSHFSRDTTEVLSAPFPGRQIDKGGPIVWPTRSLDFLLLGLHKKLNLYGQNSWHGSFDSNKWYCWAGNKRYATQHAWQEVEYQMGIWSVRKSAHVETNYAWKPSQVHFSAAYFFFCRHQPKHASYLIWHHHMLQSMLTTSNHKHNYFFPPLVRGWETLLR